MIVELHILQNFAPSNLNRDDTNSPKECQFGGYRRARISSQCIKRAIRWNSEFRTRLKDHLSSRSLRFPNQVCEELMRLGTVQARAQEVGKQLEAIAKKEAAGEESKKEDTYELDIFKTPQMVFYTDDEVRECAKQVKDLLDKGTSVKDVFKKDKSGKFTNLPVFPVPRSADIALFGRMVTSAHFVNVDAACQVAHAISTHKVGVEFDFYTAVDDLQPKAETGAGMMGDVEFNSACYYRYANIDLDQLTANLGDDPKLAEKTIDAFIRAAVAAVPTGKQNSFAAQNPPDFVFAVVRGSGAWSLSNAFVRPVKESGDLMADSIRALVDYWGKLGEFYGNGGIKATPAMALNVNDLKGMEKVGKFDDLVKKVSDAITVDP